MSLLLDELSFRLFRLVYRLTFICEKILHASFKLIMVKWVCLFTFSYIDVHNPFYNLSARITHVYWTQSIIVTRSFNPSAMQPTAASNKDADAAAHISRVQAALDIESYKLSAHSQ